MRAVSAFLLRDALDSMYARAMTLQMSCSDALQRAGGRPAQCCHRQLNASASRR